MASSRRRGRESSSSSKTRSPSENQTTSSTGKARLEGPYLVVVLIVVFLGVGLWLSVLPSKTKPSSEDSSQQRSARDARAEQKDEESPPVRETTGNDVPLSTEKVKMAEEKGEVSVGEAEIDRNFKNSVLDRLRVSSGISVFGRRVEPQVVPAKGAERRKTNVQMYTMEHFLTDQECGGLIAAHDSHTRQNGPPIFCFDSVDTMNSHIQKYKKGKGLRLSARDFTEGTACLNDTVSQVRRRSGLFFFGFRY